MQHNKIAILGSAAAAAAVLALARSRRALAAPNGSEQWRLLATLVEEQLGVRPDAVQIARLLHRDAWAAGQKPETVRVFATKSVGAPVKPKSIEALLQEKAATSGFVVVPTTAGVDRLRQLAAQGQLELRCPAAAEGCKLALEEDCQVDLGGTGALAGAFQISRGAGGLVLSHTPAVPQAYFPVASNIEVPMRINALADGPAWPSGQEAYRALLAQPGEVGRGTAAHIAWAYSSKFNTEDEVYQYIRAQSRGSWPCASPPPLTELSAAMVAAIAEGWAEARAADNGERFGGKYGPTTFDLVAAGNAGYGP